APMQSQHRLIAESSANRWRATIRGLLGSVRPTEFDAVGHEQDRGRALPDGFKPLGLASRVQQRDAVAVLSELGDPFGHFVSVERRIQEDEKLTRPITLQAAAGPTNAGAIPRSRIGRGRIQIERTKPIDDPSGGYMILRQPYGALVGS